jgi:hypothetical protein
MLLEFGMSGSGTMAALAMLLAVDGGQGGADGTAHARIGSWAGDKISIVGDYGSNLEDGRTLYRTAQDDFSDISKEMYEYIKENE